MIRVTLSQLAAILDGELKGDDLSLDAVTTDTRKLTPLPVCGAQRRTF